MSISASDAERAVQQLVSETDSTEPLRAVPTAATRTDLGEITLPDNGIDVEDEHKPLKLSELLVQAAGDTGLVRLNILPELNFVLDLFHDETHDELVSIANFSNDSDIFNIIQPLAKRNEKSGRVGVLRDPLRDFVKVLSSVVDVKETIVVSPGAGTTIVDTLVGEFTNLAENTLFNNFPLISGQRAIPVIGEAEGEGYLLNASHYLRVDAMLEVDQQQSADSALTDITVTVKFVLHLRVPLLLRESSDKFEKTLKTHFKYLESAGIKAGLPTTIFAGFKSIDLANPAVVSALNWIRETDPTLEILSYRDADQGGEFIGIPGYNAQDYADVLFNGGDFVVAFNLENEGE